MWINIVEPDRPRITRRMSIACWVSKATNTHSEYVTLIVFPLQQWLHERVSVLRYTYIACLVTTRCNLTQEDLLAYVGVERSCGIIGIWDGLQNRILSPTAQVKYFRNRVKERETAIFAFSPHLGNHSYFVSKMDLMVPSHFLRPSCSLLQYHKTHGEDIRSLTDDYLVHIEISVCILT